MPDAERRPARTVFFGSGRFGVEALRRLADDDQVLLVGVVTAPPRPAGRSNRLTGTVIDAASQEIGVRAILRPERLRSPDAIDAVLSLEPDLAVLADYGQIVPRPILDLAHGALNLHPSLLPRHRGATPIQATILAGDPETGVSLFRMDEELDTGPIVAHQRVPLDGSETTPKLEARLAGVAAGLLGRWLGPWLAGTVEARPQSSEGATLTRPLRRDDGRLDPALAADRLERQVRAFQPWPGSFVETPLGRLVVWRAEAGDDTNGVSGQRSDESPGTLVADGDGLALSTARGRLRLLEAQLAGRRRMAAADLLRGAAGLAGATVVG